MSAIASFYIVPQNRFQVVAQAEKPIEKKSKYLFFFTKTVLHDGFWDVLRKEGDEQAAFQHSGWVFNDLELFLEEREVVIFPEETYTPFENYSKRNNTTLITFNYQQSQEIAAKLNELKISKGAIKKFLETDYGEEASFGAKCVLDAKKHLNKWLGAITKDTVGILSIG